MPELVRLRWHETGPGGEPSAVSYSGPLRNASGLRLHFGYDGWRPPVRQVPFESGPDGVPVARLVDVEGHHTLDCCVTDGERWDNNDGAAYRLWIGLDPLDSHLHASEAGSGRLGFDSLLTAMRSGGMPRGIVSWRDNAALDEFVRDRPEFSQLVWVRPGHPPVADVRRRLAAGAVGLKLHPSWDGFRADDRRLDVYLRRAGEAGRPVAIHSAAGDADPKYIRRLAERFPAVPVLLYHTYLGLPEGRRRAARHAREQPNLYLETSWCSCDEVRRLVDEVGPDRVLFGSDAAVDGPHHFVAQPPNVEGRETYNDGLLALVRTLDPPAARLVLGDNARRLFGLIPRAGRWSCPTDP